MYINYSLFSSDLNFNHLFFFRSSILYHLLPLSPTPCWGYLFCTRFDSCFFCLFISALCPCIIFSSLPFYLAFFCFIASLLSSCCFFKLYFVLLSSFVGSYFLLFSSFIFPFILLCILTLLNCIFSLPFISFCLFLCRASRCPNQAATTLSTQITFWR